MILINNHTFVFPLLTKSTFFFKRLSAVGWLVGVWRFYHLCLLLYLGFDTKKHPPNSYKKDDVNVLLFFVLFFENPNFIFVLFLGFIFFIFWGILSILSFTHFLHYISFVLHIPSILPSIILLPHTHIYTHASTTKVPKQHTPPTRLLPPSDFFFFLKTLQIVLPPIIHRVAAAPPSFFSKHVRHHKNLSYQTFLFLSFQSCLKLCFSCNS